MRMNKSIVRVGSALFNHKGKILAGLASLAAAELVSALVRRRKARLADRYKEEGEKVRKSEAETKAKERNLAQRRSIYQAPQIPKANTVRH